MNENTRQKALISVGAIRKWRTYMQNVMAWGSGRARNVSALIGEGRRRVGACVLLAALSCLALVELVHSSATELLVAQIAVLAIAALGLQVSLGLGGLLSVAQAALMAIGAYSSSLLTVKLGVFWPLAALTGLFCAGIISLVLGILSWRTRGHVFILVTLGLAEIVTLVASNAVQLTGGPNGLAVPTFSGLSLGGVSGTGAAAVCCVMAVGMLYLVGSLKRAKLGRGAISAKTSEEYAAVCGVNAGPIRVLLLTVTGIAGGLAGVLDARTLGFIGPEDFSVELGLLIVVMVVVGGMRTGIGTLLGAVIVGYLYEGIPSLANYGALVYGAGVIVVLLAARGMDLIFERHTMASVSKRANVKSDAIKPNRVLSCNEPLTSTAVISGRSEGDLGLEVEAAVVEFSGIRAIDGVSLSMKYGAVVALLGANGAGKTTLINAISGLVPLTEGRIRADGNDITSCSPQDRARNGLTRTFQNPSGHMQGAVSEVITIGRYLSDRRSIWRAVITPGWIETYEKTLKREARVVLAKLGLDDTIIDQSVGWLPSGTAKLVDIGRALFSNQRLLLLDEPTSGLSPGERDQVGQVIQEFTRSGGSVLLVEHDVAFARSVADWVIVLANGRVISEGDADTALASPEVARSYFGVEDREGGSIMGAEVQGAAGNVSMDALSNPTTTNILGSTR